MTAKYQLKGRLGHMPKGVPEYVGDSDRGIYLFAKWHCKAVDGNYLLSAPNALWPQGEPMNTHYPLFLHHGFVRRDGKRVNRSRPVRHFTPQSLCHDFWTAHGHYTIDHAANRIELAFSLGMDYEFEIKEYMPPGVAHKIAQLVTALQKQYPHRRFVVKVYNNAPGKAMWLKPWSEADVPTLITTHTPRRKTDKNAQQYADNYRGFAPRWV